jgi:hypothetical protein
MNAFVTFITDSNMIVWQISTIGEERAVVGKPIQADRIRSEPKEK